MDHESKVDSYTTPLDAELAKAYLESYNICVRLQGEIIMGAAFALGPMIGGVQLFVNEEDGARANILLEKYHRNLQAKSTPRKDSPVEQVDRAWISSFIGLVTIPVLVHAYSVWLLLHVKRDKLTAKARKRFVVAWIVDVLVSAGVIWLVVSKLR